MASLYEQMTGDAPVQYGRVEFDPLNDVALNDDWAIPSMVVGGLGLFKTIPYLPYLREIWKGRNLLLHKPFDKMTKEEYNNYGKLGRDFYKSVLNKQKANSRFINGDISFPNKRASETDYRYMEQYPLLRKNIHDATKNTFIEPQAKIDEYGNEYIRSDANGFNNLKIRWNGNDYDYQIKENANGSGNDFYNIKPYELLYDYLTK